MIKVTKPYLPELDEYVQYLKDIWGRNWLTNNGPLVNELELRLKAFLGLDYFLYLNNGTIALQIAIKALGLKGKIITTPFSYVATTSSIVWEQCEPVFVDIEKETFTIDPELIENAIENDTVAILATHVFGIPCDVEKIEKIAQKYNLKVIYDAAHCFGTRFKNKSILNWGDVSTLSFHATKLFHTIEGGGVVCNEPDLLKKMAYMRNFGHDGPYTFNGVGINGKNSEFHAAMGLCNLKHVGEIIDIRKRMTASYDSFLGKLQYQRPLIRKEVEFNYAYYPIVFPNEAMCLRALDQLAINEIFARRYFYPSLSELDYVKGGETPNAVDISKRILCLPLYDSLSEYEVDMISRYIIRSQKY